jgi:peptidoglycan/LPS O-acetylase OafA/YrhL
VKEASVVFLGGALAAGYVVTALFFLRFWRETRDRLFAIFAAAFTLLALQRVLLALDSAPAEDRTWYYSIRLVAFLLILVAVVDKNRGRRKV